VKRNKLIKQWGPNSLALPVSTIDERCPHDEAEIIWDETNSRDECSYCGQPIKMRKLSREERDRLFYVHYD